jgi:predicted small metal-binding protein
MAKVLQCSDVGFTCDAKVSAESEDEVMAQAAQHAKEVHGFTDEDLTEHAPSIRAAIRDDG